MVRIVEQFRALKRDTLRYAVVCTAYEVRRKYIRSHERIAVVM